MDPKLAGAIGLALLSTLGCTRVTIGPDGSGSDAGHAGSKSMAEMPGATAGRTPAGAAGSSAAAAGASGSAAGSPAIDNDAGRAGTDASDAAPHDAGPPDVPPACVIAGTGVFEGDYAYGETRGDLSGIRTVRGNVVLKVPTALPLPCLEEVEGNLTIAINNAASRATDLSGLERLRTVGGSLVIDDGSTDRLTGVAGLSSLESVGGDLRIIGWYMKTLTGLERLRSVGGDLALDGAGNLETLDALAGLTRIGGKLSILCTQGSKLRDLHGLEQLAELDGLSITWCDALESLAGLPPFEHFEGDLHLYGLPALTSLEALASLRSLGGTLTLEELEQPLDLAPLSQLSRAHSVTVARSNVTSFPLSQLTELDTLVLDSRVESVTTLRNLTSLRELYLSGALESLDGLQGITSLQVLSITYASELTTLTGLDNLETVSDELTIEGAEKLESLAGLDKLETVGGALTLRQLPSLTRLQGLGSLRTVGGLIIDRCDALTDLAGPSALERAARVLITDNAQLASLNDLPAELELSGPLNVYHNPLLPRCDLAALAARAGTSCTCPSSTTDVCDPSCVPSRFNPCVTCDSLIYCVCDAGCGCTGNDNSAVACGP